jgi:hypothetical protein
MNKMPIPISGKENIKKIIDFSKNLIKNMEKNNFNTKFKIKKTKKIDTKKFIDYFKQKLNKFEFKPEFQNYMLKYLESIMTNSDKDDKFKETKKFINAKKDVDEFLKECSLNIEKDYNVYIKEIGLISTKYNLNVNEIGELTLYTFKKKNIDEKKTKILMIKKLKY